MSCRLLSKIFRLTQTIHLYPVLQKIMQNAFPNNNSILKNTSTSFYTILTSNIYKNYNLAKQKNALKSSACLESNTNYNKQVKKAKICKPKRKSSLKIKYNERKKCRNASKCKTKKISICMPASKLKKNLSKIKWNDKELKKNAEVPNKCPSTFCRQPSCCPVQSSKTCNIACYSNKASKPPTLDRKSDYLTKTCSLTNYSTSFKQPNPTSYKALAKQPNSINYCTPSKKPKSSNKISLTNSCASSKQPVAINCKKPRSTNKCLTPKQPGSSKNRAPTKQTKH